MFLSDLDVRGIRVISDARICPSEKLNLVTGCNGAGKTTLLESIHLLATGRGFRGHSADRLVRKEYSKLTVYGQVVQETGRKVRLGLEKGGGQGSIKVDGENARASSRLAQELSVASMSPESHELVYGGPSFRRRLTNWALFHVEHDYMEQLRRYVHVLKQRNAGIRQGYRDKDIVLWDSQLEAAGNEIHKARLRYTESVGRFLSTYSERLLGSRVALTYQPGWDPSRSLGEVLASCLAMDRRRGRTCHGPHRADLGLKLQGDRVQEVLSRGQVKRLLGALLLANIWYFKKDAGKTPVVLVDDLASELDREGREAFLGLLADTGCQVFMTRLPEQDLNTAYWAEFKLFHVEQGVFREVV